MPEWEDGRVRAAGGVPVRDGATGVEVLVVHRPRYDDWTFPKGKRESGETDEECALREVLEETGLRCVLEEELPPTTYVDRDGRPKLVRYWLMAAEAERDFVPNDETDDLRWVTPDEARALLTYDRDRDVLAAL